MNPKADDGGHAFPRIESIDTSSYNQKNAKYVNYRSDGMSLRDYFAAKALAGMLANAGSESSGSWQDAPHELAAEHAFKYADAMLKARQS